MHLENSFSFCTSRNKPVTCERLKVGIIMCILMSINPEHISGCFVSGSSFDWLNMSRFSIFRRTTPELRSELERIAMDRARNGLNLEMAKVQFEKSIEAVRKDWVELERLKTAQCDFAGDNGNAENQCRIDRQKKCTEKAMTAQDKLYYRVKMLEAHVAETEQAYVYAKSDYRASVLAGPESDVDSD